MSIYSKRILSESVNGRGIKVGTTGTPGTLIHTAVTGTVNFDEVHIYAVNTDAGSRLLTIEYGGVSAPDDNIEISLNSHEGLILIVPNLVIQNSLAIRAFADAADVIVIFGFVNRITV